MDKLKQARAALTIIFIQQVPTVCNDCNGNYAGEKDDEPQYYDDDDDDDDDDVDNEDNDDVDQ